jgi:hypothetical protein
LDYEIQRCDNLTSTDSKIEEKLSACPQELTLGLPIRRAKSYPFFTNVTAMFVRYSTHDLRGEKMKKLLFTVLILITLGLAACTSGKTKAASPASQPLTKKY